jgi:holdfast attachment protein HfaA
VIVDGVILDGASDTFTQTDNSGAGGVYAGAGGRSRWSTATAIGNNLQVITQGNYNTVIVNSTQINNGDVTANNEDSLNGELDLND